MAHNLTYRILELSYKNKLSHIGSNLTCLPILEEIYFKRKSTDPVILSCGHAGLALYCVLEQYESQDAQQLIEFCGVHPEKIINTGIWCSTGSLGQGITIAVGRALADLGRDVWCVISDGEMYEGSVYESLMFAKENNLTNLKVFLNYNGFSAYKKVKDISVIKHFPNIIPKYTSLESSRIPFLTGLDAHYYVMNEKDWLWVENNKENL